MQKNKDLYILYELGIQSSINSQQVIMRANTFYNTVEFYKVYLNFLYAIDD